ncbi:MAG: elongation factor T [Candidatus Peregrinibacteria bacterium Gr01-1014_25]|nr:MAG: elongation factor T [Candidatus Peregrinibacteria bacterium Gr01-1014_25]
MSPVSASAVSHLRARTGVSILACKEALEEANGDEEKAIELLRKRGIAQAAKKAERAQTEGRIFSAEAGGKAALVLLRCETDFVARADAFTALGNALAQEALQGETAARALADAKIPEAVQALGENVSLDEVAVAAAPVVGTYVHTNGKVAVLVGLSGGSREAARDVGMHAAAMSPQYRSPDEVSEDIIAKEKEIWREQLKKEGKPEAMFDKIMIGKEKKFREENALVKQPFVKDPSKTIEQYLGSAQVTAYVRLSVL